MSLCGLTAQTGTNIAGPAVASGLAQPQFDEVTFSLTGGSLYLYTGDLSEGLARVLNLPDEPANGQALIAKHSHLPRQQRLQQLAYEASRLDYRLDDLTILLIKDQGVSLAP